MVFKSLFLAHVPDADMEKHRCVIETSLYKLFVIIVRNQQQAVSVAKNLLEEEGIQSILLCPGFTHADVAEIQEAVKDRAGVCVARGDSPSSKAALAAMEKAGWFKR
jgi:pyruvate kinase